MNDGCMDVHKACQMIAHNCTKDPYENVRMIRNAAISGARGLHTCPVQAVVPVFMLRDSIPSSKCGISGVVVCGGGFSQADL